MVSLRAEGVHFSYNGEDVLSNIGFRLKGGALVGLVGPNGSGKSTLLKILDRILSPRKGKVLLEGRPLSELKGKEIAKKIGYVPQSTSTLFPKTVFDTVLMGRIPYSSWAPTKNDLSVVNDVLVDLELADLSGRTLNSLSGGQRQKVMIARALAQGSDILLLDEPTSSLDLANQIDVMELIEKETSGGKLAIMAVHDLNLALRYCDSFMLLKAGMVVASGSSDKLSREVLEEVYDIKAKMIGSGREKVLLPISRR